MGRRRTNEVRHVEMRTRTTPDANAARTPALCASDMSELMMATRSRYFAHLVSFNARRAISL